MINTERDIPCGSACPSGWACMSVEGTNVCFLEKQVEASGGGCGLPRHRPQGPRVPSYVFLLGVLVASWRRRRRQRRATGLK